MFAKLFLLGTVVAIAQANSDNDDVIAILFRNPGVTCAKAAGDGKCNPLITYACPTACSGTATDEDFLKDQSAIYGAQFGKACPIAAERGYCVDGITPLFCPESCSDPVLLKGPTAPVCDDDTGKCCDGVIPGGIALPSQGYQCEDWGTDFNKNNVTDCAVSQDAINMADGYSKADLEAIRAACPKTCEVTEICPVAYDDVIAILFRNPGVTCAKAAGDGKCNPLITYACPTACNGTATGKDFLKDQSAIYGAQFGKGCPIAAQRGYCVDKITPLFCPESCSDPVLLKGPTAPVCDDDTGKCCDGVIPGGIALPSQGYQCEDWGTDFNKNNVTDCAVSQDAINMADGYSKADLEAIRAACPKTCEVAEICPPTISETPQPTAEEIAAAAKCAVELCATQSAACLKDTACAATITAQTAPPAGSSLANCTATEQFLMCVTTTVTTTDLNNLPGAGAATQFGTVVGLVAAVAAAMFN